MASILYLDGSTSILPLGFPVEIRPQPGVTYNDLQINVTAGGAVSIPAAALAAKATVNVPTGAKVSFNTTTGQFEVKTAAGAVLATLPALGDQSPKISIGGGAAAQVKIDATGTIDDTTLPSDGGQNPGPNPGGEGQTFTLTTGDDIVTGTTGDDTIDGALKDGKLTFTKGDVITDGSSTDNDTLNLTTTADIGTDSPVVSGIETINVNVEKVGAFAFNAAKVAGAKTITINRADALGGAVDGTGAVKVTEARSANFVAGTKVSNVEIEFSTAGNAVAAAVVDASKATGNVTVKNVGQGGVTVNSAKDKAVTVNEAANTSGSKATINSSGTVAVTSTVDLLTLQGADAAAIYTVDAIGADGGLIVTGASDVTVKAAATALTGKTIKNTATGKVTLEATATGALDLSKLDSVNSVVLGADFGSSAITIKDGQLITTKTNQADGLNIENAGAAKTGTATLGLLGDVTFAGVTFGSTKAFDTISIDASAGKFTATKLDAKGANLVVKGGKDVKLDEVTDAATIISTDGKTTLISKGITAGGEQSIVLGKADDTVTVDSASTVFAAVLGDGKNTLTIKNAKDGSSFATGAGNDSVEVVTTTGSVSGEAVTISTGAGDDLINVKAVDGKGLVVDGGAGNDSVAFAKSFTSTAETIVLKNIEAISIDTDADFTAKQFAGFGASELKGTGVLKVTATASDSTIDASKIKLEYNTTATVELIGTAATGTVALTGTNGNDKITAATVGGTITGGKGADTLIGVAGVDTFVFAKGDSVKATATDLGTKIEATKFITFGNGVDIITGFTATDKLDLANAGKLTTLEAEATAGVTTALADGSAYVIYGTWADAVDAANPGKFTIADKFDATNAKDALLITDGGTTIANSESIVILNDLSAALAANVII